MDESCCTNVYRVLSLVLRGYEDPEEEIVEDPEEYLEEEISEISEKEKLAVENSHLSSAKIGGIDSKGLVNELNEDPEAARGNKVVQGSGSETISKSVTPTGLCHNKIVTPHEDQKQYLEEPVVNPSSISNASKAGYQLENDCEFGSPPSKTCDSHKVLGEEYLKLEDNFASAVRDHNGKTGLSKVIVNDECDSRKQEHDSSGKRRRSRWDHNQGMETQIDGNGKRRKTRWDNNDFQHGLIHPSGIRSTLELAMDPKIISLKVKLLEINKKLHSPEIYDERPEGERSPSPEPVYNNLGMRINTRDVRVWKKLMNERSCILSKLAKTNLTFKSPAKPKTTKFVKKLFVPEKEYPKYNFIGLILGPKGNTQKKMEKKTGAKILLRGKGSGEPHPSEDDDLHVRVEAANQQALDAAVAMIEKLLIPVEDQNNDTKELSWLSLRNSRGTYKDNNICDFCKEQGHRKYACPLQDSTFEAVCCDACRSIGHPTSNCGVSKPPQISSKDKSNKEGDNGSLYVGYLSLAVDEQQLKELFLPFGKITKTTIVKDQTTGLSKGYGFVKFENPLDAAAAMAYMNGYKMDGKMLAVRVAGRNQFQTSNIYGPPTSILPEAPFSTAYSESLCFSSSSSYSVHNVNVATTQALNFPPYASSKRTDTRVTVYNFVTKSLPHYLNQHLSSQVIQITQVPSSIHTSPVQ
ncbi:UNVERIFIED_CONTAM: Splicing factor-like protein 1 [Sesamum angustifolium]|uniref:Branchpoint-bridging protein n=1 Tax=Sesamum angustifolium TaxID=2727405 RepID=A0AAW2LH61_9LAMI